MTKTNKTTAQDISEVRKLSNTLAEATKSVQYAAPFTQNHRDTTSEDIADMKQQLLNIQEISKDLSLALDKKQKEIRAQQGWAGEPLRDRITRLGLD